MGRRFCCFFLVVLLLRDRHTGIAHPDRIEDPGVDPADAAATVAALTDRVGAAKKHAGTPLPGLASW